MPECERAYLSLGSNIEPMSHLPQAIAALGQRFGAVQCSPVYQNPAVGYVGPDFLNLAAAIDCPLSPNALHAWLRALEQVHGRDRSLPRFADRPLDVDVVLFGARRFKISGGLALPRPELHQAFVLKPLCDLAPARVAPGTTDTLASLWRQHPAAHLACWQQPVVRF